MGGWRLRERFVNPWASEQELCDALKESLEGSGWRVYTETNGFDLWAIAGADGPGWKEGDTMGLEAKMAANIKVICQAADLEKGRGRCIPQAELHGPHFRVAAVPRATYDFGLLCRSLGVKVWECSAFDYAIGVGNHWRKRVRDIKLLGARRFEPRTVPKEPDIKIDVPAGVPCPRKVTPWKIKAVTLMLRLKAGERLTSAEIAAAGMTAGTFRDRGWIQDSGERRGRAYVWEAGPGTQLYPTPDLGYPEVAAALREKGVG